MEQYRKEVAINFKILGLVGFWPFPISLPKLVSLFAFHRVFVWINWMVFIALASTDLFLIWGDVNLMAYNLCITFTSFVCLIKLVILHCNLAEVERLRSYLDNCFHLKWVGAPEEDRIVLRRSSKQVMFLFKLFMAGAVSIQSFWLTLPLISTAGSKVKELPFRMWCPDGTLYYYFAYAWQIYISSMQVLAICVLDLLYYGFLIQISAYYDILINKVKDVEDMLRRNENRNLKSSFSRIFKLHQHILRALRTVDGLCSHETMLHFMGLCLVIAVIGFNIVSAAQQINQQQFVQLQFLAVALFDLLLYCYCGSRIEHKSYELCDAVYSAPWEEMALDRRRDLMIVMLRAQHPPRLRAGNLYHITLPTFVEIIQVSYSLLLMLRKISH